MLVLGLCGKGRPAAVCMHGDHGAAIRVGLWCVDYGVGWSAAGFQSSSRGQRVLENVRESVLCESFMGVRGRCVAPPLCTGWGLWQEMHTSENCSSENCTCYYGDHVIMVVMMGSCTGTTGNHGTLV